MTDDKETYIQEAINTYYTKQYLSIFKAGLELCVAVMEYLTVAIKSLRRKFIGTNLKALMYSNTSQCDVRTF